MNTTKIIRFSNKSENKGMPSSKSKLWNKNNKNKNITNKNKNPTRFYYKEETKQDYNKKTHPKLVLNYK
jgi:peptide methionine sulfoxide reductase MsrA